jgi:D-arginine dehydrogenase
MAQTADIIVIGGGIAGISAAAELARKARVIVLETEKHLGYHATGRSAAIYIRNYGNATLRRLNAIAHAPLAGALLGESVLSPRGEMLIATEDELEVLETTLAGAEGMERLTAAEAVALVPVLRQERIAAAVIERDAQDIDVDRLLQGNARLCRDRGGQIETGQAVGGLARAQGMWRVETTSQRFEAPVVVNAAGAWADRIAGLAGLRRIGLQPLRRSAVIMGLPPGIRGHLNWPLFGSVRENWYAKPDAKGLMISPADEDPVEPQDAWPDDMVLAEGLYRFEQVVDVPVIRPSHSWAGLRSFVADRTPVVGFAPETEGFFWLAGQGGYGVQTSPALAAITHALCCAGGAGFDRSLLDALSPARFD